jgi:peptidyl-prolyl cis-trans isomerase C
MNPAGEARLYARHGAWLRVAGLLAGLLVAGLAAAQERGVAARVNGAEISNFRLERHFEDFLKERGRNVGALRNPAAYKRLRREALEQLIDRELLVQEAGKRGIAVDDAALAQARAERQAGFKSHEAFLQRIADAGFDAQGYDDYLRRDLAAQRALAELAQAGLPTDEELRAIYAQAADRFVRPPMVQARHILFKVPPGADTAQKEAARQKALAALAELRAGADFADFARRLSEDGATAPRGGDLGFFPRGVMVPAFEQAAFTYASGEIGGPVETPFGWHLIRVDARSESEKLPEAEALALIRSQIEKNRRPEVERQALQQLRAAAKVEVLWP